MISVEKRDRKPTYSEDFVYWRQNLGLKYTLDKIIAGYFFVVLLPLLILIVLSIKIEALTRPRARGPAFIYEERISQGEKFFLYKFRTYFLQDDTLNADKKGTTDFINDRDLTFVGNVLRKYYLDELPQLVNIIKGEMSFIGPRPVPEDQYISTLEQGYQAKRVLRAGLDGPVQALKGHRRDIGPYLAFDDDLIGMYHDSSTVKVLFLDLRICWQTLKKIWEGDGLENPTR